MSNVNVMISSVRVLNPMSDCEYISCDVSVIDDVTHDDLVKGRPISAALLTDLLCFPDGSRVDEVNPYDKEDRIFNIKALVPSAVAEDFRVDIYAAQADRMQAHTDKMSDTCFCGATLGHCDCEERYMDDDRGDSSGY